MEQLTDLKAILHSKRANIYYLEKCRILQKDGRVLYLTEAKDEQLYWNIPIANTTVVLLGTGTSITQAAVRMLASAGVLIGFSGGGGTPLLMGTEIEWFTPQSEYRPTEYVQGWLAFWFNETQRLRVAKHFQLLADRSISIPADRRRIGAKLSRASKPDHRRQLRKVRSHAVIHIAGVARPDIKQLDHVANGWRIVFGEFVERGLCDAHGGLAF